MGGWWGFTGDERWGGGSGDKVSMVTACPISPWARGIRELSFAEVFHRPSGADSALMRADIWLLVPENRWEASAPMGMAIIIIPHATFAADTRHRRSTASDLKGEILNDRPG